MKNYLKIFSEGTLGEDEIYKGLINGCATAEIAPCNVWFGHNR